MSGNLAADSTGQNVERLIFDYVQGKSSAGDRLAEIVGRIARKRFRRLASNDNECEELTQECVLAVFQRMSEYSPTLGNFDAWVYGFAHNTWRSHLRALARQKKSTIPIDDVRAMQYEIGGALNQRENLAVALESLEIVDRELLHMRYSLGMSSEEIAAASDMNPPQVRKRISRAVERLRRHPATQALLMSLIGM